MSYWTSLGLTKEDIMEVRVEPEPGGGAYFEYELTEKAHTVIINEAKKKGLEPGALLKEIVEQRQRPI